MNKKLTTRQEYDETKAIVEALLLLYHQRIFLPYYLTICGADQFDIL